MLGEEVVEAGDRTAAHRLWERDRERDTSVRAMGIVSLLQDRTKTGRMLYMVMCERDKQFDRSLTPPHPADKLNVVSLDVPHN